MSTIKVAIDQFLSLDDAKERFSTMVDQLANSTDLSDLFVITKSGKPVVALVNLDNLAKLMKDGSSPSDEVKTEGKKEEIKTILEKDIGKDDAKESTAKLSDSSSSGETKSIPSIPVDKPSPDTNEAPEANEPAQKLNRPPVISLDNDAKDDSSAATAAAPKATIPNAPVITPTIVAPDAALTPTNPIVTPPINTAPALPPRPTTPSMMPGMPSSPMPRPANPIATPPIPSAPRPMAPAPLGIAPANTVPPSAMPAPQPAMYSQPPQAFPPRPLPNPAPIAAPSQVNPMNPTPAAGQFNAIPPVFRPQVAPQPNPVVGGQVPSVPRPAVPAPSMMPPASAGSPATQVAASATLNALKNTPANPQDMAID